MTFDSYVYPNAEAHEIVQKCRSYVDNFGKPGKVLDQGTSLCLVGAPGTGKTHIACAMGVAIAKAGYNVAYKRLYELMRQIKNTYAHGAKDSEEGIINNLTKADLLILDEVGLKTLSEHESSLVYQVIDQRYEAVRPTVIVSNLSEEDLGKHLGPRTIDRMYENHGAVFNFDWDSYRRK